MKNLEEIIKESKEISYYEELEDINRGTIRPK